MIGEIFTPPSIYGMLANGWRGRGDNDILPGDRINCPECGIGTVAENPSGLILLDAATLALDGGRYARWCDHYQDRIIGSYHHTGVSV